MVLYVGTDRIDLNNDSIVMKCTFFNNSYLFTSDATNEVEYAIANGEYSNYLKSDVLKISHHGSRYSNSAVFLNKVKPSYAVISVGKDNEYNHPHQVTLDKLNKLNSIIYRTDQNNTIHLTSDGEGIEVDFINKNLNGGDIKDK